MKWIRYITLALLLLLVSCQTKSFDIPSEGTSYLIVSHIKEETLTFVDVETHDVLLTERSFSPLSHIVSIGKEKLVATSRDEDDIFLYDLSIGERERLLKLNKGLHTLFYDEQTNELYVTDVLHNKVHVIDMETKKVTNNYSVGLFPSEIMKIDNTLYVLNFESSDITVIDKDGTKSFPVIERPSGMFYDGNYIWIGGHGPHHELNEQIVAYDRETFEKMKTINVGLMPIAFYGDHSSPYFYVLSHGDNRLYKVEKQSYLVIDQVAVGQNPNFVSGNDRFIFVTNFDSDSLSIIDKETFKCVEEISVPSGPYAIVVQEE